MPGKNTFVVTIDDDVADFLSQQGQIDPGPYINQLLRQELKQSHPSRMDTDELQEMNNNAPFAAKTGARKGSGF